MGEDGELVQTSKMGSGEDRSFLREKNPHKSGEDKTAVSNAVKTESELVYEHKVCHKTVRGLSSLKTSSWRMVSRYVIALTI